MGADVTAKMTEREREAWSALTVAAGEIVAAALPLYVTLWVQLNASGLAIGEAKAAFKAAMPTHVVAIEAMLNAARIGLLDVAEARNPMANPD